MTLRRRRHWSSYTAHQQVNCQGSPEGGCDTPYLPLSHPLHPRWQYKFVCDADSIIDLSFDFNQYNNNNSNNDTL